MRTFPSRWPLLLVLVACDSGDEAVSIQWGAVFTPCTETIFEEAPYSVQRWCGTESAAELGDLAEKWKPSYEKEVSGPGPLTQGFPGRGASLSPIGASITARFEPSTKEWPEEVFAQAAERVLREHLHALVSDGLRSLAVDHAEWSGSAGQTRVLLRFGAEDGGARKQRDAVWRCRWRGSIKAPILHEVELLSATEVACTEPAFEDVTDAVFGDLPFFESELLLGNDAYHQRTDVKVSFFFAGLLGMAVGDVDGDGWEDVYLSQLGSQPNRLLVRGEGGAVKDATVAAQVGFLDTTRGALFVDLDGDAHLDLALAKGAEVALCWNDGKGGFADRRPLDGPGKSPIYSISAGDGDDDGDLDLFCSRYPHADVSGGVPSPYHEAKNGVRNLYWRNEGGRSFVECAEEVGLADVERFTYMAAFDDFDGDGDQDLYVVNDYGSNQLYENDGGHFKDVAAAKGAANPAAGMGLSIADCDLDGELDLYVSNMHTPIGARVTEMARFRSGAGAHGAYQMHASGNALLFGEGGGAFSDRGAKSGVEIGGWSWGAIFGDWNNDGWPDLYVPNGFQTGESRDELTSLFWRELAGSSPDSGAATANYHASWQAIGHLSQWKGYSWAGNERNYAYMNIGEGEFVDASYASGTDFLDDGRVASALDWDGDGALDLLLRNRTGPRLRLMRGTGAAKGASLSLALSHPAPNTGGVGARVKVIRSDGKVLTRTKYAGEGFLGQSSQQLHFGLGTSTVKLVELRWPDGVVERHEGVSAGRWKIARGEEPVPWERPAHSALAGQGAPSREVSHERASRVVLADKLPALALEFPAEGQGKVSLEELVTQPGKRGALVVIWDPESEQDQAYLKDLAGSCDELRKGGISVIPVRRGKLGNAGELLSELGFADHAARMTPTEDHLLQLFLLESIGTHDEVPMPISMLFDGSGGLCSLYFGSLAAPLVLPDAHKLRYRDSSLADTTALTGGLWLARPKRDRSALERALKMLGQRELAYGLGR